MILSVSNNEGTDFMQNMYTVRATAESGRVRTSYVRVTHEEINRGRAQGLALEMVLAMAAANA